MARFWIRRPPPHIFIPPRRCSKKSPWMEILGRRSLTCGGTTADDVRFALSAGSPSGGPAKRASHEALGGSIVAKSLRYLIRLQAPHKFCHPSTLPKRPTTSRPARRLASYDSMPVWSHPSIASNTTPVGNLPAASAACMPPYLSHVRP